jgi:3-dehydroquinate synthase
MYQRRIEKSFSVPYTYRLYFTSGIFSLENELLASVIEEYSPSKPVKVLFVADQGVTDSHPMLIESIQAYCSAHTSMHYTHTLIVPGGEQSKNEDNVTDQVVSAINDYKICRHSFVIAIGGGAVVDMAGYAAAIAHRGVKLIRIPTTVLAQNDAAVGVKNSINRFGKKNFVGTFAPPHAIINDENFLKTLDQRDWIAGTAEGVKVALIKDEDFFDFIESHATRLRDREMAPMQELIYRCAELHMEHIAAGGDPFESGSSRPLDFGHWSAHKLEYMTNYSIRHGEAVAVGMALDMAYAHLMGVTSAGVLDRVLQTLTNLGFQWSVPLSSKDEIQQLLQGIEEFREHLGGTLTITLVPEVGRKIDVHEIDREMMKRAVELLSEKSNSLV